MKLTLNDMLLILACIILAWMMTACKTPQPIVQTEVKEVIVEREVRDSIVTIAPDSASNVLIKELQESQKGNESRLYHTNQS